jgi:hypothetical protein
MKLLKILLIAILFGATSYGQVTRGTYGTQSPFYGSTMHIGTPQGISKAADTLVNTDTGYLYIFEADGYARGFDVTATKLTGTVATYTITVSGCNNNGKALTATSLPFTNCHVLTGNTTYCTDCIGANSTTTPATTGTHYYWQFPYNAGALFDKFVVTAVQTGTTTTVYSGKALTEK